MSERQNPDRHLPVRPNLDQLKHQAKDLLRAVKGSNPAALAEFQKHHPAPPDPTTAKLADAQLALARSYGVPSWPRIALACRLIDAIWRDDEAAIRDLISKHQNLLHENARGTQHCNWGPPMSYAANLGRDRIIQFLHAVGAKDLGFASGRAVLQGRIDTARLLHALAGNPPPPRGAVIGSCETLSAAGFAYALELGAEICDNHGDWRAPVALALETYSRNPPGKHQILEMMAERGIPLPDTPPMAVHRGRIDLLAAHLRRDPRLLSRTFSLPEFYPPELGCLKHPGDPFHGTPLEGATLLHQAIDYGELEIARWLLDHGMGVDTRAVLHADGFGGHTPLFSAVVSYSYYLRSRCETPPPSADPFAELLLERGADPNARASLRSSMHVETPHEYRDVTPLSWGQRFHDQALVSRPAMQLIAARGGHA